MNDTAIMLAALTRVLRDLGQVAVAVSGGVDSMTLATVARRTLGDASTMFHAVSPAVPPEATARVRRYAAQEGWRLQVLDAGEFSDREYLDNPVDRCFYCKNNLYASIARHTRAVIVSGANVDDLSDYRPGLQAAREHGVRHPYLEAKIDKAGVRTLARYLGLADIAELPAAPCLSSRVETGIPIQAEALTLIHQVERYLSERLNPRTVRCRVRAGGVAVELDHACLDALSGDRLKFSLDAVETLCRQAGFMPFLGFEPYRLGSAFVHGNHHV